MELTASEAWARILERARPLLPEPTFRIWLEQTEPLALTEDLLAVGAGSDFAAEWIDDHYGPSAENSKSHFGNARSASPGRQFGLRRQHINHPRPHPHCNPRHLHRRRVLW
jgi:chromosomal replication initiation ATPase DnaA